MRKHMFCKQILCLTILAFALVVSGCSSRNQKNSGQKLNDDNTHSQNQDYNLETDSQPYVINKEYLDSYKPQRTDYNFYFTYKIVHSWWDAVALKYMRDGIIYALFRTATQLVLTQLQLL